MAVNTTLAEEIRQRWDIFRLLAPYFGKIVSAQFIQATSQKFPSITRIHNLIEGIYKPTGATYALAIASMLKNPYADHLSYKSDRSWYFSYSPKRGSLDSAVNSSLFSCMRDGEPVLVLKQLTTKADREGTKYRLMGLGLVEDFDVASHLFQIREVTIDQFQQRLNPREVLSDDLIDTALQLEAFEQWAPFVAEDRAVYQVSKFKRDAAFRRIVVENYSSTCAALKTRFVHDRVVEVQAAHIIGKDVQGTDDPRNGIALSHTAHWAFDLGIFSISDQYEIIVHPKAKEAESSHFPLLDADRTRMMLPADEANYPHQDALAWHRKEVFGRFCK